MTKKKSNPKSLKLIRKIRRKLRKKRKAFTLIELLAVIVILGLLMAIAIPSVTKYITESRKKTVTTTIGNYIGALTNQVNDMEYIFTATNTIYAVPIECISLERGGKSPFGEWHQANDAYWAYVLIQYDDISSSYIYGFTFKDSAGYGMYPVVESKIQENGKQIQTNLDLSRPVSGDLTTLTTLEQWEKSGFKLDETTDFIVLEAEGEGNIGDGKETCTLCQKGNNYDQIEEEKKLKLSYLIKSNNSIVYQSPTLTTASNNSSDANGLYLSTDTNSGSGTYYFRGNVQNNYVKFAGLIWRIVRINEDKSIRLILNTSMSNTPYSFNDLNSDYTYMYYSNNSTAKRELEKWYNSNLKNYDKYIAYGFFCEEARVKYVDNWPSGKATMQLYSNYSPTFRCSTDLNGYGPLKLKIGLLSYDEVVFAGAYPDLTNNTYYLYNGSTGLRIMSPSGYGTAATAWYIYSSGSFKYYRVSTTSTLRPVINLNGDVLATGSGTYSDPYVVKID